MSFTVLFVNPCLPISLSLVVPKQRKVFNRLLLLLLQYPLLRLQCLAVRSSTILAFKEIQKRFLSIRASFIYFVLFVYLFIGVVVCIFFGLANVFVFVWPCSFSPSHLPPSPYFKTRNISICAMIRNDH